MERSTSLILKLPVKVCNTCTDTLSRWCNPTKPGWMSYYDGDQWRHTVDEKHFENRYNELKWAWKVHELKNSASKCVCCQFLVQCLDASPWIAYGDDDFIELKPRFVGSTHTDLREREMEDNSLKYGNSRNSQYERFYRPRLQLFKITTESDKGERRYAPDDYLFILPFSQSGGGREGTSNAPVFHGRLVEKNIDYALTNHWFTLCKNSHDTAKLPKPKYYGSEVTGCEPTPLKAIPHFRLVDVKERRVVLAEPGQKYAALSYVWGNSKRLLLCSENLEQLSEPGALAQDNENVPKTFRDALAVAAALRLDYTWLDALCIKQDDEESLVEHMDCMDQIYGAAVLTIVCDTTDVGSGIPGVSRPREPTQATLQHGNTTFISSKRTFGRALYDSAWESRAWCLQEKVFSRRLLIFTETQAFYHCNSSTWFEDTVLELTERTGGSVGIAERASPYSKSSRGPSYTAYEAHRKLFGRNFWTLVEIYSKRNLSFESDTIRAFSGILKSIESGFGRAIWGIPQGAFTRGLTWTLSPHIPGLRRSGFPSWSWAGWRGNGGSTLEFTNTLTNYSDVWDIEWYHYQAGEDGEFELAQIDDTMGRSYFGNKSRLGGMRRQRDAEPPSSSSVSTSDIDSEDTSSEMCEEPQYPTLFGRSASDYNKAMQEFRRAQEEYLKSPSYKKRMKKEELERKREHKLNHTWMLPGHPKEPDYIDLPFPPLAHNLTTMPPITHILRFYTSVATLDIDPQPDPDYRDAYSRLNDGKHFYHAVRLTDSTTIVHHLKLGPESRMAGRRVEFIYISRGYYPPSDEPGEDEPEILNIVLIDGDGEVKQKVQSCGMWGLAQWRKAEPAWKLINLA